MITLSVKRFKKTILEIISLRRHLEETLTELLTPACFLVHPFCNRLKKVNVCRKGTDLCCVQ